MIYDLVIQAGHTGRTRGFTGTSGPFGAEIVWTRKLAVAAVPGLQAKGWKATWTLADAPMPDSRCAIAVHQDGSLNKTARGPSVGYANTPESITMKTAWKAYYRTRYPGPAFRPDGYTPALARYYMLRPSHRAGSSAPARMIAEHGFATNYQDAEWMWSDDGIDAAIEAMNAALWAVLGPDIAQYVADLEAEKAASGPQTPAKPPKQPQTPKAPQPPAEAATGPLRPAVPEPAEEPATVKPMSDANARSLWTALQTAVPAFAGFHLLDINEVGQEHLIALSVIAAVLSWAKSALQGRLH